MESLKVLVADDHESFRRSLLGFLRTQHGVEIIGEVADGNEAVDQAEKLHPDLVLIDSDMPNQDGFRATHQIKLRSPETMVVVLSMHGSEVYRRMARECLADGFIEKSSMKHALCELLVNNHARLNKLDVVGVRAA